MHFSPQIRARSIVQLHDFLALTLFVFGLLSFFQVLSKVSLQRSMYTGYDYLVMAKDIVRFPCFNTSQIKGATKVPWALFPALL